MCMATDGNSNTAQMVSVGSCVHSLTEQLRKTAGQQSKCWWRNKDQMTHCGQPHAVLG